MGFLEYLPVFLTNIWLYGIIFVATITFVIFIHEMGHYLAARACGVRAELFSLGFGRELIGHTDKYGSRWSLRLYPFGGYVRMFGEQEYPELMTLPDDELKSAFFNKPVKHRAFITAAGPVMNFAFALVLLSIVYMTIGRPSPPPSAAALELNGPAHQAGMKIGDVFLEIDGNPVDSIEMMRTMMAPRAGVPTKVKVRRGDDILEFDTVPKSIEDENSYGFTFWRGSISAVYPTYGLDVKEIYMVDGIDTRGKPELTRQLLLERANKEIIINFGKKRTADYIVYVHPELNQSLKDPDHTDYDTLTLGKRPMETMKASPPLQAIGESLDMVWRGMNKMLGTIFQVFAGTQKTNELGGVIKISTMTADMAGKGTYTFLSFVALLSVSIGMFNLLPIPLLDGGHLMFQAAEAVKGSPVSPTAKGYTYGFGLIFLLLAIFIINLNDLLGLLKLS